MKITIDKITYNNLLIDSLMLECLENAGVDNWDGYSYAMKNFEKVLAEEGEDNEDYE